ncbi:MAG: zinc-ribbon domain containing protein [Eubacteriales bacterium]
MTRICKDCGAEFTLSQGEIDFYKEKNFNLPQRCKSCRKKRKGTNTQEQKPSIKEPRVISVKEQSIYSKIASIVVAVLLLIFWILPKITNLFQLNESYYDTTYSSSQSADLEFRSEEYLSEHFSKHGGLLGHYSKESYLLAANNVIKSSSALKRTQSDGDTAYYQESSNEFVVVSTDGYIRTYFKPTDGKEYFYRQ